ncbi:MAG TPA: diguanylate cyclase [Solirubrobacteraceae bacterium]|nr:diguanylate cyclase [Solirubrobacteraceae bacterium]
MATSHRGAQGDPIAPESGVLAELQGAVLDALDSAVTACDSQGRVTFANATAAGLWPAQPGAVPGWTRFELLDETGATVGPDRHPLQRALGGERVEELYYVTGTEGHVVPVLVRATPLECAGVGRSGAMMSACEQGESEGEARLRNYISDFEILTEVSRMLADVQDAEAAASVICTVAIGFTGAIAVLLWELQDGALVLRGQEGMVTGAELATLTERSRLGAAVAVAEAATRVDESAPGEPAGTAWHELLFTGGRATGALSIVWPGILADRSRPQWLIEALAHHAATALERADLVRRLDSAARTDPLTGLPNRRVWDERVQYELARAGRDHEPLSMVLLDMDRFKRYNDRFGHPQGDRLLRDAALAWAPQLRTTDLLARVGGEEFAVLLPCCPLEDACRVAERLRTATPHGETCSLGVAEWDGAASASALYAIADEALYRAKEGGRNRLEVARPANRPGLRLG